MISGREFQWEATNVRISHHRTNYYNRNQEYTIEREGEYPISPWACITTLYEGRDLCNDVYMLEASFLAVCGHVYVAKSHCTNS